jgi:hypothetical protein
MLKQFDQTVRRRVVLLSVSSFQFRMDRLRQYFAEFNATLIE